MRLNLVGRIKKQAVERFNTEARFRKYDSKIKGLESKLASLRERQSKYDPSNVQTAEGMICAEFEKVRQKLIERDEAYLTYQKALLDNTEIISREKEDKSLISDYTRAHEAARSILQGGYDSALSREKIRADLRKSISPRITIPALIAKHSSKKSQGIYLPLKEGDHHKTLPSDLFAYVAEQTLYHLGSEDGRKNKCLFGVNYNNGFMFMDIEDCERRFEDYAASLVGSQPQNFREANLSLAVYDIRLPEISIFVQGDKK